ncbi:hypothetical protein J7W08_08265 [Methanococcoides orientis]|uniref:DUF6951 family protein n=1 Tax=Methanococcoides orientis TaxID=2822137 RepID=UPI001E3984E1|nr:hypothetical protein [Methanococcoides orientis]UGV40094.1 hypothetical protein J7W08_08265 [Methanococcoides orientis]
MTDITVNSRICGFTHKIHGTKDGKNVKIKIETQCPKVKNISELEVPMMQLFGIKENIVTAKAQEGNCCATCLVPCGILHACNLELGLISQKLAKDVGNLSIEFE